MLRDTPPGLTGGNQQQPVHAFEGGGEGIGLVVVRLADLKAAPGESLPRTRSGVCRFLGGAHGGDDLRGVDALVYQGVDDEPAQVAGDSSYSDHDVSCWLVLRI
jgi:hypothetical protein